MNQMEIDEKEKECQAHPTLSEAADDGNASLNVADDSVGEGSLGVEAGSSVAESGDKGSDEPGDDEGLAKLLEEAEHRGYIRGRNESIERLMKRPGEWEQPRADTQQPQSQPQILTHLRPSVWDL